MQRACRHRIWGTAASEGTAVRYNLGRRPITSRPSAAATSDYLEVPCSSPPPICCTATVNAVNTAPGDGEEGVCLSAGTAADADYPARSVHGKQSHEKSDATGGDMMRAGETGWAAPGGEADGRLRSAPASSSSFSASTWLFFAAQCAAV